MTLTVGSLFSGIGGIDLGLERAGMRVIWNAEVDPFACQVLAHHWPHVPNLGDVTRIDWSTVARPDVLAGGYPCQPFSVAGRRQGAEDPRHLWPHYLDAIRHLRPRFALLENVPGHRSLGFAAVLADLAAIGYDAEWDGLAASHVGAPHRRDRLFCVAYPASLRPQEASWEHRPEDAEPVAGHGGPLADADDGGRHGWPGPICEEDGRPEPPDGRCGSGAAALADADDERSQGRGVSEGEGRQALPRPDGSGARIFRRAPRSSGFWAAESDVGRVAHGLPSRVDARVWRGRIRALGNAVVPHVAQHVGELIIDADARTRGR